MGSDREGRRAAALSAAVCSCLLGTVLRGQAPAPHGMHVPVPREVIALTASEPDARGSSDTDPVHDLLQMPLDFLGVVVRIHELKDGPPPIDPRETRAVLTFFESDAPCPAWLWPWLHEARSTYRLRVVHFGDLGPLLQPPHERLEQWLAGFGLALDAGYVGDPLRIAVHQRDAELCSFESRPVYERVHRGPRSTDPNNRAWVTTIERGALAPPRTPVVTGPWGGLALHPWVLRDSGEGERRWYIDPFRFFREALGLHQVPAPDPCVLNGRRLFVLHIDGDGFESVSTARPGALSARIMLEEVLERYQLPTTVSVIVASVTDEIAPAKPTPAMALAAEIFAKPYVEVASHAVLHPLNWQRRLTSRTAPRTVVWYPALGGYQHSMEAEVRESIRFINERLCPPGKRCQVMLWSGAANPTEAAVRAATESGCLNLNGGIYRWDAAHNSVGYVSPWGKQLGAEFQVYAGASNENVFEGFFSTMPGSYGHIDTTIENTGSPRILKPANLYVHFYCAERPGRLRALHDLIERWAYSEPTAPVFASVYARAVLSARRTCRIARTPGGWSFRGFEDCRTARIDGETREIDWGRSRGLLGAKRMLGALFVHLAAAEAELVFGDGIAPRPHVESANHAVQGVALGQDSIELTMSALTRRDLVLAGFPPDTELVLDLDGEIRSATSDSSGRLQVGLPEGGRSRLKVRVR